MSASRDLKADFATFVRTIVILLVLAAILSATGEWQNPAAISVRTYLLLTLSDLAAGALWSCSEKRTPANWLGVALMGSALMSSV